MLKNKTTKTKTKTKPVVTVTDYGDINPSRKDGWTMIEANKPLYIEVTPEHVLNAKPCNGGECVIAQALMAHFGGMVDGFRVGSNITKVFSIGGKTCTRYSTSGPLADALRQFDRTGQWGLKPGMYTLLPLAKSYRRAARFDKMKHSGGTKSVFSGTKAKPTRHAETVCQIMRMKAVA